MRRVSPLAAGTLPGIGHMSRAFVKVAKVYRNIWPKDRLRASDPNGILRGHTAGGKGGPRPMAIHLTPTELARESGLERRDVIVKCVEWVIPIFNGRIDKPLFLSSLREITGSVPQTPQQAQL